MEIRLIVDALETVLGPDSPLRAVLARGERRDLEATLQLAGHPPQRVALTIAPRSEAPDAAPEGAASEGDASERDASGGDAYEGDAYEVWLSPAGSQGAAPDGGGQGEREGLRAALDAHCWRRDDTARALGISRTTLWRRMRDLGL